MPKQGCKRIAELDAGLEIWLAPVSAIREQDRNAQVMPPAMLDRPSETIERDGRLESLPFVALREKENGGYWFEMISGHHRYRAARQGGLQEIYVVADTTGLDRSQLVAKQIAHNAIHGASDRDILREMWDASDRIEDQYGAFLDPEDLGAYSVEFTAEGGNLMLEMDWRVVSLYFLPHQKEDFDELLETLDGEEEQVGAVSMDLFKEFQKAVKIVREEADVRSMGTVVHLMAQAALEKYKGSSEEAD